MRIFIFFFSTMIKKMLLLGVIGVMLVNDVAGLRHRKGAIMAYDETTELIEDDYVSENLDDPGPEIGPSPRTFAYPIGTNNEKSNNRGTKVQQNITSESVNDRNGFDVSGVSEPVGQNQGDVSKEDPACRHLLCEKIDRAIRNNGKKIDREIETIGDRGKSMVEAEKKIILSIPKGGLEFILTIKNVDDKSRETEEGGNLND